MKAQLTQEAKAALIDELNSQVTRDICYTQDIDPFDMAVRIVESFQTSDEGRCIPVEERLPEEGKDVLVYQNDNICKASYGDSEEQSGEQVSFYVDLWDCGRFVTHWQPLPKGPRDESA